ncbi:hypothetical protein [Macrococcus equipercicus]|uniref:Uncharacterized protein n=1 Tax=Macrococcus equipercicus TaxID=69967 RepID=A0A9Q9BW31_9STAP|nr:hypothetical protein [Macrococcus equipercicus]KAA1042441.1 hypothetical protein ERX35_000740 [Macrococcus equipercicus]UTH14327.1 hypothetical protein KFV11_02895 [Macrococcus equipercicus]
MNRSPLPVKRWGVLDTINLCLMIFVCLFVVDFQHNPLISWLVIAAFGIWALTVLARNIYLSKYHKQ